VVGEAWGAPWKRPRYTIESSSACDVSAGAAIDEEDVAMLPALTAYTARVGGANHEEEEEEEEEVGRAEGGGSPPIVDGSDAANAEGDSTPRDVCCCSAMWCVLCSSV
jgi:hypothetical protein